MFHLPNQSIAGTIVFLIMVFIVSNAFFIIVDLTGMPKFVQKYRIQVGKNVPVRTLEILMLMLHFTEFLSNS